MTAGVTRVLRIGSQEIERTADLIQEIHSAIKQLKVFAVENRDVVKAHSDDLARAIEQIEALASAHRLTQESLDALGKAIASMPSESRTAVMNFLTGLSSSIWASALIEQVKRMVGM